MSAVGQVAEREERPAYVRFERVPEEDRAATLAAGHYVAKDVDYALITPPYSKDVFKSKVSQWLQNMQQDVSAGRLPEKWMHDYKEAYHRWQNGQELPVTGTPIKGWGVISPAQQETLIRMNCLTVEDLAAITDEGLQRIGMGAVDLKSKARTWLAQMGDRGPLTVKMAALENENAVLKGSVETLTRQVGELAALLKSQPGLEAMISGEISASDILPDNEDLAAQYTAKFGERPHHRMKPETIAAKLKE